MTASHQHRVPAWIRVIANRLPPSIREPLRRWWYRRAAAQSAGPATPASDTDYAARAAAEIGIFEQQVEVHDLPPIFHYWSNTWLRPAIEAFGFSNPDDFFALHLARAHADAAVAGNRARFVSIGCGNCDTEVRVARLLVDRGIEDFTIECIDINPAMLQRGRMLAAEAGVADRIHTVTGDFNVWRPAGCYDAVMANQSLHHVVNLEGLFDAVRAALGPHGRFVTSDMIGRNGHQRWPEALALVREYWNELPAHYRRNVQLQRNEETFLDWDCSGEGFEGIRAQDILPLLLGCFRFEFFFAFGNLIDPFIDRGFGPHFDADAAWDRDFIDRVHLRDEAELRAGRITPTHMFAVLRAASWTGACTHRDGLPPERCVRVAQPT